MADSNTEASHLTPSKALIQAVAREHEKHVAGWGT